MAEKITMPRLSDTMEEGKVVKWHKNIGDTIAEGDILAEIETDKAIQEFESEFNGTLLYQGIKDDEIAKVDSILAIIGKDGEDISSLLGNESTQITNTVEDNQTETSTIIPTDIPSDVNVITMPRLSDTMEVGTVAKWHKNVGETVTEGDILAEIETDKAVQEFESEFDGVLLHIGAEEGEATPVDTILAIIGQKGTDVSSIINNVGEKPTTKDTQVSTPKEEPKINTQSAASTSTTNRIFASPLAKKIANEKGIDLTSIKGSGDNGRIIKKDVENYAPSKAATNTLPLTQYAQGEDQVTPNSQVRKVIAKRLTESKYTAPHYYLNVEANMDNAIASRASINALPDTKISFNDIIIKACAMALRKHPQVNSTWHNDYITTHGNINIGVAVAIEDGLLVPVVKNTDFKSFTEISSEIKDLAGRARERKLKAEEMEGSTFSVSNLGMFGIESFTSIINQPNSTILSVGAIVQKPIVKEGQIVVGNTMKLCLACDHRTVDGATGAQFLQTLVQYIENPLTMFV